MSVNEKPVIQYKISVENEELPFSTDYRNILECTEAAKIEIHYHCRDGFCGACRVTLASGAVAYPNGEPLAYINDDEILPCCCIPASDISLTIE